MKKRTVTLVLAIMLALSVAGCGSSSEPKQEETPQEIEQEENTQVTQADHGEPVIIEEQEDLYIYDCIYEADKKFLNLEEFNSNDDTPYHITDSLDLYLDTGALTGITKPDTYVNYVRRSGDGWVFIPFRKTSFFAKEEEFDKLAEKISDEEYEEMCAKLYTPIDIGGSSYEYEETKSEEAVDPYDEILETAGYNKDKAYTIDEYMELLTNIFKEMGKEYNTELASMSPFENYDGFRIQLTYGITDYSEENIKHIMNYIENGKDGWGGITEFCVVKGQNEDGKESISVFTKIDNEVVEKHKEEWQ